MELNIKPTKKQYECWKKLLDNITKYLLFGGGAGGGKSWLGCEWLVYMCLRYPQTKYFIGRNELKRLMASTYITLLKVCKNFNISPDKYKLNGQFNYIQFFNNSRIDLLDVAYKPSDPLYERFGSTEYTSGWLEEVGEIPFRAYDVLKSRIGRHLNKELNIKSKIFMTCNPKKNWVYREFFIPNRENTLSKESCFIKSLYKDNPYTAKEYEENLKSIKDKALRERLMNGNWEYDDDPSTLIEYDAILDMFKANYVFSTDDDFFISCDVARFGKDRAIIMLWQGWYIKRIWDFGKCSTKELRQKIESVERQYKVPRSHIVIDSDGVGGGVADELEGCKAFVNGSAMIKSESEKYEEKRKEFEYNFANLKSQCAFHLAEKINKRNVGVYEDIATEIKNDMIEELEQIKRKDIDKDEMKIRLIGKDEVKDNIGRSPDISDSMIMRSIFDLLKQKNSVEVFALEW